MSLRKSSLTFLSLARCLFNDSYPIRPTWDAPRWQPSLALMAQLLPHPRHHLAVTNVDHPRNELFPPDRATTETSIRGHKHQRVVVGASGRIELEVKLCMAIMNHEESLPTRLHGFASVLTMLATMMPPSGCRSSRTANLRCNRPVVERRSTCN